MTALFEVTEADLALLDPEGFDTVWSALGIVVLARAGKARPAEPVILPPAAVALALQYAEPVTDHAPLSPTAETPPTDARSRSMTCADCGRVVGGAAGLSSHRRSAHGAGMVTAHGLAPAPVDAATPVDFTARARNAASRTWDERVNGADA